MRRTLNLKRQEYVLSLQVPASLVVRFEIGINILTSHLRDLSESEPGLISRHWASGVPMWNLHSLDIGSFMLPEEEAAPLCPLRGRRASSGILAQPSARCSFHGGLGACGALSPI